MNIGNKVRIKSLEDIEKTFTEDRSCRSMCGTMISFPTMMERYCGMEVKITAERWGMTGVYEVEGLGTSFDETWCWHHDWLEQPLADLSIDEELFDL